MKGSWERAVSRLTATLADRIVCGVRRFNFKALTQAVLLALLPRAATTAEAAAGGYGDGVQAGQITNDALADLSGIAASRQNPGVLWVHNDRGLDQFHAVGTNGQFLGTWIIGDTVDDFEDIAMGPGPVPGLQYLYCGDIGDNAATRANIRVYRTEEPAVYLYEAANPLTRNLPTVEKFTLTYPDGSHNAEALLVDPLTGDLFVATKETGRSRLYRATQAQLKDGTTIQMEFAVQVDFHIASAGDISPNGKEVLLRQEEFAEIWHRGSNQTVAQALQTEPDLVPVVGTPIEPNGEGVGFAADGRGYYTVSEGVAPVLYFFPKLAGGDPLTYSGLIAPAARWTYLDDGSDQGTAWRTLEFADSGWSNGLAQLGYGDDDEQTVIRYGPSKKNKFTTTYFRHVFKVDDPSRFASLRGRIVFDDGVAVYLNGAEVLRRELDPNARSTDLALSGGGDRENLWQIFEAENLLRAGTNVVAVEVHRHSSDEGTLSFDLQLEGKLASASLHFTGSPRRLTETSWALDFIGATSSSVVAEASDDLQNWVVAGSSDAAAGAGSITVADEKAARFYRLRQ